MDLYFFSKQTVGGSRLSQKRGQIGGPKPKFSVVFIGFSPKLQTVHPVRCCIIRYSTSQFHSKYYFGQEEEMRLCLMILSVPWYMFNGLEHTVILSHFLTFITGSSSRLLRIRLSADLTLYWFPVCHFRCKEFNPLVIWIWNQNIAISTIVGTSSHIKQSLVL